MRHEQLSREVGNWVDGERFWDREHELAELTGLLEEGANVLIAAPRRTGKTSLMREAGRLLGDRYAAVHVDLQGARSIGEAIAEIAVAAREHQGLWQRTRDAFADTFSSVTGRISELSVYEFKVHVREAAETGWRARGDQLLALLAATEPPVILFLDELPILINRVLKGGGDRVVAENVPEVDQFLSWLRAATIRHRGRLRVVVAGSIGIEPVLRQARLSATLNTFAPFELGPWEPQVAIDCIKALARRYELDVTPDAARRMVDLLGSCVPHHVQLFFSHVLDAARRERVARVERRDVEEVFRGRMLSTRGHVELQHMEERLRLVLPKEHLLLAMDLLTEAAVVGQLTRPAAILLAREALGEEDDPMALPLVLGILEHDGYLAARGEGHHFASNLLREWWRARFSSTFTPTAERAGP